LIVQRAKDEIDAIGAGSTQCWPTNNRRPGQADGATASVPLPFIGAR
jgi:hypothetical protein